MQLHNIRIVKFFKYENKNKLVQGMSKLHFKTGFTILISIIFKKHTLDLKNVNFLNIWLKSLNNLTTYDFYTFNFPNFILVSFSRNKLRVG